MKTFEWQCVLPMYSHSPFRQHKTKDKSEIDNMTLNMVRE